VSTVYVSAGSNIDPVGNLRLACRELELAFGALALSSVYRSPAIGFDGDDFLNMVISFETGDNWERVAGELERVERIAGRDPDAERLSSRSLDLDLLLFGDDIIDLSGVSVPRSDITKYAFVLRPMTELAPELRHPVSGVTMRELWEAFDPSQQPTERLAGIYQPTLRPPSTAMT
jgi:2-amino-4-hydroxy-6-hydroxymethyldihydropteridine diphosphokinase